MLAPPSRTTHRNQRQLGFTLIELALVVGIFGLLIGVGLTALSSQVASKNIAQTRGRMSAIREALVSFVANNGHLPCPAVAGLAPGAADYGIAADYQITLNADPIEDVQVCLNTTGLKTEPLGDTTANMSMGIVPWITLGIPDAVAQDGWGRRFSYIVDNRAAHDEDIPGYLQSTPFAKLAGMQGNLRVHSNLVGGAPLIANQVTLCRKDDDTPIDDDDTPCANYAVVAAISHGANGAGAYLPNGNQIGAGASPKVPPDGSVEIANVDDDFRIVDQSIIQLTNPNPLTNFDDIVMWLPPSRLLQPVIETGVTTYPRALLAERFEKIKDALVAFSAADSAWVPEGLPADRAHRRRVPFAAEIVDPLIDAEKEEDGDTDGFVPYDDLGLRPEDVIDPWGFPIRYRTELNVSEKASDKANGFHTGKVGPIITLTSWGPDNEDDLLFPLPEPQNDSSITISGATFLTELSRLGVFAEGTAGVSAENTIDDAPP